MGLIRFWLAIGLIQILTVLASATDVAGDTLWFAGQAEPLCGRIVSQTDDEIRIEKFADGKFGDVASIPAKKVDSVIVNLDTKRLAELSPDFPVAYRNYAEELCTQQADAAAIHVARRLYLLAAANSIDPSQSDLRSGALLGLISLSPNESQRRKLELLHRLTEPGQARLKPKSTPTVNFVPTETEKELMLKVVVAIRQEDSNTALGLLNSDPNRESLKKWSTICTPQELDRMATAKRPSTAQLRKLLAIELAVRQPEGAIRKPVLSNSSWGELAMQPAANFNPLPTFANVTEFDPGKSVYRDEVWVSP